MKDIVPCHAPRFERSLGVYWASEKHLPQKQAWQDPEGRGGPVKASGGSSPRAGPALSAVVVLQAGGQLPRTWLGHQTQAKAHSWKSFEEKGKASS